jgi:hypothetical protein
MAVQTLARQNAARLGLGLGTSAQGPHETGCGHTDFV